MSTERLTTEAVVRAASDRFYEALDRMANGDAEPMAAVWSHRDDVTPMHPIGGREVGWNEVEGPWQAVAVPCLERYQPVVRQVVEQLKANL